MNTYVILFIITVFFHIWDDFGRQGILASMKQKSWWHSDEYKNDWIPALIAHSFSWATMISIPSFVYSYTVNKSISFYLISLFIVQAIIHFIVDNEKCNKHRINLCIDQSIHLVQIIAEVICVWLFV